MYFLNFALNWIVSGCCDLLNDFIYLLLYMILFTWLWIFSCKIKYSLFLWNKKVIFWKNMTPLQKTHVLPLHHRLRYVTDGVCNQGQHCNYMELYTKFSSNQPLSLKEIICHLLNLTNSWFLMNIFHQFRNINSCPLCVPRCQLVILRSHWCWLYSTLTFHSIVPVGML